MCLLPNRTPSSLPLPALPTVAALLAALATLLLLLPTAAAAQRDCFGEFAQCMGAVTNEGLIDSSACTLAYFDCLFELIVVA
jgi:hypothetical protein